MTDEAGKYRFINLKPGQCQVWCNIPGGNVYYGGEKNITPTLQVGREKIVKNVGFRFVPLKQEKQIADEPIAVSASPTTTPSLKPLLEARTHTARVGADAMDSVVTDAQDYTWFTLVAQGIPYFYRFDEKKKAGSDRTSLFKRDGV